MATKKTATNNEDKKMTNAFTPEQIADFWESIEEERQITVRWLRQELQTDEGKQRIEEAASILASRHGFSHDTVKSFRSTLRAASESEGLNPPLSLKKTKDSVGNPYMAVVTSKPHKSPKKSGEDVVYDYLFRIYESGKVSINDINNAVDRLNKAV